MSVIKIVSRYAKSLFDLAKSDGKLDQVHEDIMLTWEVAKNEEFSDVLKSPIIPSSSKEDIFKAVFGERVQPMVLKTFMTILDHKREAYLVDFCRSFHLMYNKETKVSTATLTTVADLSDETVDQLLSLFKEKGLLDNSVELTKVIDKNIIGGFVLEFEDKVYDSSIIKSLDNMRKKFNENLYIKNI